MKKLNDQLEDFASIPVPKNIRYSGLSIAMVTAVMVFGAPKTITAVTIAIDNPLYLIFLGTGIDAKSSS